MVNTIRVQHPTIAGETMLINESDFDASIHLTVPEPGEIADTAMKLYEELGGGDQESGELNSVIDEGEGAEAEAELEPAPRARRGRSKK